MKLLFEWVAKNNSNKAPEPNELHCIADTINSLSILPLRKCINNNETVFPGSSSPEFAQFHPLQQWDPNTHAAPFIGFTAKRT